MDERAVKVSLPCVRYGTVRYRTMLTVRTTTGPNLEPRGLAGWTKSGVPQVRVVYCKVLSGTVRYVIYQPCSLLNQKEI